MKPKHPAIVTADALIDRAVKASNLVHSVRRHLLEDQEDAISARGDGQGSGGISDPTPHLATLLAPFAAKERLLVGALVNIDKAYDHLEVIVAGCISTKLPASIEPLCPGWTAELRGRLGGCGKVLESYKLASGKHQYRSTMLCVGCRKDKDADERAAA